MVLLLGQTSRSPSLAMCPQLCSCPWPLWGMRSVKHASLDPLQSERPKHQEVHRTVMDENWKHTKLKVDGSKHPQEKALTFGLWYKRGQSSSPHCGLESLRVCSVPWRNSFGCPCQEATSICTSSVLRVKMSDKIRGITNTVNCSNT